MMQQIIEAGGGNFSDNKNGQQDPSSDRFIISQERADVTGGAGTLNFDVWEQRVHIHQVLVNQFMFILLFSNDDTDSNRRRSVQEQV